MHIAKMTSDGQVTIPEELRSKLGLEEGDELVLFLDGWKVQMFKRRSLSELAGALPATRPYPGKEAVRQEVGKALAKKILSEGI